MDINVLIGQMYDVDEISKNIQGKMDWLTNIFNIACKNKQNV